MALNFDDIIQGTGSGAANTQSPTRPPSQSGGGLDFSDILQGTGGMAGPGTANQLRGVPQPVDVPIERQQEVIQGGIKTAQPRVVQGQTYDASNGNFLTKAVAGVGNFLLGSAPDILARDIQASSNDRLQEQIVNDAKQQMDLIQSRIQDAQQKGDTARVQRLTNTLANYVQDTNDLLGEDLFQKPTTLQTAGAVGTVAANLLPFTPIGIEAFRGAKIGTKLGQDILGNVVETGVMRKAPSLLQRAGQAAVETGLFTGSDAAADTGDIRETAKATALGLGLGAITPPAFALTGRAMSPIVARLENPLVAKTEVGRTLATWAAPVKNLIQGVGQVGKDLYTKLENIRINRDLFRANADQALGNFAKVYSPLSEIQKDEFYNIVSKNTAANPEVKKRGAQFTTEELMALTQDPLVKEAIRAAEPVTKEISQAQAGRAFKGGAMEVVNRETGDVLPSIENLKGIPVNLHPIAKRALETNTPEQLIKEMAAIEDKAKLKGIDALSKKEKEIYQALESIALGQGDSVDNVLNEIFNASKVGTIGEREGGVYGRRSIKRVAEESSVFFPTVEVEQGTRKLPNVEDRAKYFLENDNTILEIAKTDIKYAEQLAREKAEAEIQKIGLGPSAGKAKEMFYGDAAMARENGINTNALEAYQQFIDRESSKSAQLQEFGAKNITGKADATLDEIAQANLDKIHGEIRAELEKQFGMNSVEAKKFSDIIKEQTDIFLHGGTTNDLLSNLKKIQALKLGLSFLPNLFQTLNDTLAADLPSLTSGLKAAFTGLGRRFAEEAGAKESSILSKTEVGIIGKSAFDKFLNKYLKVFKFTEQNINRTVAANTGAALAERLAAQANYEITTLAQKAAGEVTGKDAVKALTALEELVGKTFERGKAIELTEKDLLRAANRFTKATQFGSNPLELPFWANSELGSVFFQFKSFAYNQLKFVADQTVGELRRGNPGRATRNFTLLATLFPMSGAALNSMKNLITGSEHDTDLLTINGYLNSIASVGGLGIVYDVIKQSSNNITGATAFLAGPTAGSLSEGIYRGIKGTEGLAEGDLGIPLEQLWKLTYRQLGGLGSTINNVGGQLF